METFSKRFKLNDAIIFKPVAEKPYEIILNFYNH